MSALSAMFLWLLPLALLPVIIHMLNRLRYQTVKWAAMMFLRTADRDASRRAKVRQWLILAARCLMLLMFLLALARLQSKGRLARFFDSGSKLVVVLFDRSASMEQTQGGTSGREKALALVQQGLSELSTGSRVIWIDSATGEAIPLAPGVALDRLPFVETTSSGSDVVAMMRRAMQEIARAGASSAEVWIPTDRQAVAWQPEGTNIPDWTEWIQMDTQITLRLLDVSRGVADPGNRGLQLGGLPERDGAELKVPLRLIRDTESPETVTLTVDFGGLRLQEKLLVEGTSFVWEQVLPIEPGQEELSATFLVPADSNSADNEVVVAWRDRGAVQAKVETEDPFLFRVSRAAVLPREGLREVVDTWENTGNGLSLLVRDSDTEFTDEEKAWVESGGVVLLIPAPALTEPVDSDTGELGVEWWNEQTGVFSTEQREPLRLDLLRVKSIAPLKTQGEDVEVLARLEGGESLLVRQPLGDGAVYELAVPPHPDASNLADGYVWVPMIQRLLQEGRQGDKRWGQQILGDWTPDTEELWVPFEEGQNKDPIVDTGLYTFDKRLVALNRPVTEDQPAQLAAAELASWAEPLELLTFEAADAGENEGPSRVEFTSILAWLGLLFLAIESWLLTKNIRRPARESAPSFGRASA